MSDVTQILGQIENGDGRTAGKLLPLVYDELRKLAAEKMAHEKPGRTLQATALVHEAYSRFVDVDKAQHWEIGECPAERNDGRDCGCRAGAGCVSDSGSGYKCWLIGRRPVSRVAKNRKTPQWKVHPAHRKHHQVPEKSSVRSPRNTEAWDACHTGES